MEDFDLGEVSPPPMLAEKRPQPEEKPRTTGGRAWDSATPVNPNAFAGRLLPNSLEAEEYLLSCCLLDGLDVIDRCLQAKISGRSFFLNTHTTIFECLLSIYLQKKPIDIAVLAEELKAAGRLIEVGGYPFLMQVTSRIPTTANAGYFIEKVRDLEMRRELIRLATKKMEDIYNGESVLDVAADFNLGIHTLTSPTFKKAPAMSLSEFKLPPDGDPSILLGNRFLNRGDGMVISGPSGVGKSSISLQKAALWALGRKAFGIKPNGPLSSIVIQSEDSEGDVAEIWTSVKYMLKLTPDETALVDSRVKVISERVLRGERFMRSLEGLVDLYKPDLVFINPLQAFMDGDVTDSKDLGRFLREGLNGVNNGRFGYVIVHHTTKPATGKERAERQWHEVMYDMAGGAEIINWARGVISLRPSAEEGQFNLVLAKRGKRAGITKQVEHGAGFRLETVTTIGIKHASGKMEIEGRAIPMPIIFWEESEHDITAKVDISKGFGRPSKYDYNDFKTLMPEKTTNGLEFSPLLRALSSNQPLPKGSFNGILERWCETGFIEKIQENGRPTRWRKAF